MSVQYLLDGYNAIHRIPQMAGWATIREARENLLRYLKEGDLCGSPKNQMTVVFDGQPGICYPQRASSIKIVFSSKETADDKIKSLVAQAKNKKSLYVITDDKALGQSVRGLGAKTISIKDFFGKMEPGAKASAVKRPESSEKYIPKVVEFKINDELKKIWID